MAFPTDWGRKCAVTIDYTKVGASLTDFPVLITKDMLPSEMFDADGSYPALNGGGDVRFSSDSAGNTQLPLEVVSFVTDNNPTNGSCQMWVKVPSLSSSANTTIYVWYNKSGESQPAVTDTYGAQNVWRSEYKGVWNLNETSSTRYDSTANNNDLTDNNTVLYGTGKFTGNAADFEANNSERLSITDGTQTGLDITGNLSISGWVNFETAPGATFQTFAMKYSGGTQISYVFDVSQNGPRLYFSKLGNDGALVQKAYTFSTGTWYHVAVVFITSTSVELFVNGSSIGSGTHTKDALYNSTANFQLGALQNDGNYLDGKEQMFKVYAGALTSTWLSTEYNNQNSPSTFATAGTPETPSAPAATWTPKIIIF